MFELDVFPSNHHKQLKIMNIGPHGFVGLNELFESSTRRCSAICATNEMIILRFSYRKRIIREWRRLFKSSFYQQIKKQSVFSYERALADRVK
jgi:hypothetical protein